MSATAADTGSDQEKSTSPISHVALQDLRPHPRNPRKITAARLEQLKRALAADPDMLDARPLIALPDGTVIAGNQRLRAAIELGWTSIPVVYADLDEARATEWMLRDNRPYGDDDAELTGLLLAELAELGADLDLTGYASAEIDALLAGIRAEDPVDPDEVPPLPVVPRSKLGEVYELGPHRLMCGDATSAEDVATLMAGEQAALMVTDPPYGVGVDHRWREAAGKSRLGPSRGAIIGDDCHDWQGAYELTDAPVAYVWHAAHFSHVARAGLEASGFEIRQQIIWVKTVHALGRSAYHWKHEPCWYAVRKGANAAWNGGRAQTTVWEASSPIHIMGGTGEERTPHPTQKPVAIFDRPIGNHTTQGEVVYDPFAGSGTTMVAAEQLGRRAFMVELDLGYCDVIRDRYARFTGAPNA